jgi:hypothetical protein
MVVSGTFTAMNNATREFWAPERTVPTSIRRQLEKLPFAQSIYGRACSLLGRREAASVFENARDFCRALYRKDDEEVVLRTHDGLNVAIRKNLLDAEIVREIFFEKPYTRRLKLPPNPVVVDVGGYIGDFALYAVKYLGAQHVVAYEPTDENFAMLERNIALNGFDDRVTAVRFEGDEITLAELLDTHQLDSVDLLKVDCEGAEYDILPNTPDEVFDRVENIAFEYHEVDGYEARLEQVLDQLSSVGYRLYEDGNVVSGSRA